MSKNPLEKLAELPETHQELFLAIASGLADAEPWVSCPADVALGVQVPALGLADARLVVLGHGEEAYGFLLFYDAFSHRRFVDVVNEVDGAEARMPRYAVLSFDVFTPEGGDALVIPSLTVMDRETERAPDTGELDQLLAVTAGLTRFLHERSGSKELAWVWNGGPRVEGRYAVELDGTGLDVVVQAPAVGVQL